MSSECRPPPPRQCELLHLRLSSSSSLSVALQSCSSSCQRCRSSDGDVWLCSACRRSASAWRGGPEPRRVPAVPPAAPAAKTAPSVWTPRPFPGPSRQESSLCESLRRVGFCCGRLQEPGEGPCSLRRAGGAEEPSDHPEEL